MSRTRVAIINTELGHILEEAVNAKLRELESLDPPAEILDVQLQYSNPGMGESRVPSNPTTRMVMIVYRHAA